MKIKMITTAAGPNMILASGRVYDISGTFAKQLIDGGYAIAVEEAVQTALSPIEEGQMPSAPTASPIGLKKTAVSKNKPSSGKKKKASG